MIGARPLRTREVLDRRARPEPGRSEVALERPVVPVAELPVDEQPETLLEAEGAIRDLLALFDERSRHARRG